MPIWAECWGMPWGGFWWIFPLIGLTVMAVMIFGCLRMMGGHRGAGSGDSAGLRRELQELKDEVRKLRDRN